LRDQDIDLPVRLHDHLEQGRDVRVVGDLQVPDVQLDALLGRGVAQQTHPLRVATGRHDRVPGGSSQQGDLAAHPGRGARDDQHPLLVGSHVSSLVAHIVCVIQ